MHADPHLGVTDPHCRVHSVRNLFVSGGSVFPTSGHANPTFTLVALAIRLADHLKSLSRTRDAMAWTAELIRPRESPTDVVHSRD